MNTRQINKKEYKEVATGLKLRDANFKADILRSVNFNVSVIEKKAGYSLYTRLKD